MSGGNPLASLPVEVLVSLVLLTVELIVSIVLVTVELLVSLLLLTVEAEICRKSGGNPVEVWRKFRHTSGILPPDCRGGSLAEVWRKFGGSLAQV